MTAALIDREDMMDFSGASIFTLLQTFLAERMSLDVKIANLTPMRTIDLVVVRGSNVFVILTPGDGLVLRTEAFEGNLGTAGVRTGVWDF